MPKKQSAKKPAKVKARQKKKKESCKDEQPKVEDFTRGVKAWISSAPSDSDKP
jgi:hypothetical protein